MLVKVVCHPHACVLCDADLLLTLNGPCWQIRLAIAVCIIISVQDEPVLLCMLGVPEACKLHALARGLLRRKYRDCLL